MQQVEQRMMMLLLLLLPPLPLPHDDVAADQAQATYTNA
jgi:hypothetical protein